MQVYNKRKQLYTHIYIYLSEESVKESVNVLYEEDGILHMMKKERSRGSSTFLYCPHRSRGCTFIAKLIKVETSFEVQIFTANAHNHEMEEMGVHKQVVNRGLTQAQRDRIEPLLHVGLHVVTPQSIILQFNHMNSPEKHDFVPVPSRPQLNNYLAYLRRNQAGATGDSLTLQHIIQWCTVHRTADDENIDKPFVVDSFFAPEEDNDNHDQSRFRVSISTKRLLVSMPPLSMLHADASYKLMWQGYPCLLFGFSDRANHFHPVMVGISEFEKGDDDFAWFFNVIFANCSQPSNLMSDAASSIKIGASQIWDTITFSLCYAHLYKSINCSSFKLQHFFSLAELIRLSKVGTSWIGNSRDAHQSILQRIFSQAFQPLNT